MSPAILILAGLVLIWLAWTGRARGMIKAILNPQRATPAAATS